MPTTWRATNLSCQLQGRKWILIPKNRGELALQNDPLEYPPGLRHVKDLTLAWS
jgi:hypothetical protein